jgi:amino acid transporter
MFSYTTGGPFGLEDMVTTSGPGMTLIYLLILPFFWCIPVSLVSAELTTAMPVEGGFYRWTRAAFGDFWGFLAGWWNWSASFLLGGAYAVLFTDLPLPEDDVVGALPDLGGAHRGADLDQRARHPDGRATRHRA